MSPSKQPKLRKTTFVMKSTSRTFTTFFIFTSKDWQRGRLVPRFCRHTSRQALQTKNFALFTRGLPALTASLHGLCTFWNIFYVFRGWKNVIWNCGFVWRHIFANLLTRDFLLQGYDNIMMLLCYNRSLIFFQNLQIFVDKNYTHYLSLIVKKICEC